MASTSLRLVAVLALAAWCPALSELEAAAVANETGRVPEAQLHGAAGGEAANEAVREVSGEALNEDASVAAANATEQARANLAALEASGEASANLRGASGWGHGIFGETCCMCSMHVGWNTVLYAAADYSNFFGGHAAQYWCQQQCEAKCYFRGGHMFGCYDEQLLLALDRQYGHRAGYQILHDQHFGNIC